jgi:hypothetical protein
MMLQGREARARQRRSLRFWEIVKHAINLQNRHAAYCKRTQACCRRARYPLQRPVLGFHAAA